MLDEFGEFFAVRVIGCVLAKARQSIPGHCIPIVDHRLQASAEHHPHHVGLAGIEHRCSARVGQHDVPSAIQNERRERHVLVQHRVECEPERSQIRVLDRPVLVGGGDASAFEESIPVPDGDLESVTKPVDHPC